MGRGSRHGMICAPAWRPASHTSPAHYTTLVHIIPHLYTLYFTCTHHTILACTMPHLLCAHNAPLLCSSFQRAANQLRTRTSDTWQMHSRFPLHSVFVQCRVNLTTTNLDKLFIQYQLDVDCRQERKKLKTGHRLCQWSSKQSVKLLQSSTNGQMDKLLFYLSKNGHCL